MKIFFFFFLFLLIAKEFVLMTLVQIRQNKTTSKNCVTVTEFPLKESPFYMFFSNLPDLSRQQLALEFKHCQHLERFDNAKVGHVVRVAQEVDCVMQTAAIKGVCRKKIAKIVKSSNAVKLLDWSRSSLDSGGFLQLQVSFLSIKAELRFHWTSRIKEKSSLHT